MISSRTYYVASLALLACFGRAQDLSGCAAVDCPNRYVDMLSPTCQVNATDMRLVGVLSATNPIDPSVGNLTWTVGDSGLQETIMGDIRTTTRTFFLGTPPSLDRKTSSSSYMGCAFFFVSTQNGAFNVASVDGAPQYVSSSLCDPVLGGDCVSDLEREARQLAQLYQNGSTTEVFCSAIAEQLSSRSPVSCFALSQQYNVEGVPLTGTAAPEPITSAENETANCWPTLPKSNDLTWLFAYNHTSNLSETVSWLGYTPVMSLFFANESTDSTSLSSTTPAVHLMCLKVVDSDDFSAPLRNNGTGSGSDEGGAVSPFSVDRTLLLAMTLLLVIWAAII